MALRAAGLNNDRPPMPRDLVWTMQTAGLFALPTFAFLSALSGILKDAGVDSVYKFYCCEYNGTQSNPLSHICLADVRVVLRLDPVPSNCSRTCSMASPGGICFVYRPNKLIQRIYFSMQPITILRPQQHKLQGYFHTYTTTRLRAAVLDIDLALVERLTEGRSREWRREILSADSHTQLKGTRQLCMPLSFETLSSNSKSAW